MFLSMPLDAALAEQALYDVLKIWSGHFGVKSASIEWSAVDSKNDSSISFLDDNKANDDEDIPFLYKERRFEVLSENAYKPTRATNGSAGYDFRSPVDVIIRPRETISIDTGIRAFMPSDEVLLIYPRSSVALHKHIVLANTVAVIDSDFKDEIILLLTNTGKFNQRIERGDKIAQGVFQKFYTTDDKVKTTRRGGIGSSDSDAV